MAMGRREKDFWPYPSLFLAGELTGEATADILWWLGFWKETDPGRRLSIFVDSAGGDLFAATAIAESLKISPNPIATVAVGRCYSGAAPITAFGDKGDRWAYKNADFMLHQLQITNSERTSVPDIQKQTVLYQRLNNTLLGLLSQATGRTIARIDKDTRDDMYMDSREALEYGLIDHIAKWTKAKSLLQKKSH